MNSCALVKASLRQRVIHFTLFAEESCLNCKAVTFVTMWRVLCTACMLASLVKLFSFKSSGRILEQPKKESSVWHMFICIQINKKQNTEHREMMTKLVTAIRRVLCLPCDLEHHWGPWKYSHSACICHEEFYHFFMSLHTGKKRKRHQ